MVNFICQIGQRTQIFEYHSAVFVMVFYSGDGHLVPFTLSKAKYSS